MAGFLTEKELVGAYIIDRANFKTTRIRGVSPDGSQIFVKWDGTPDFTTYLFPRDFMNKVCFADQELSQKLEMNIQESRPTRQPVWVEEKEKSDFSLKGNTLKPYHFYGTAALNIYHKGCKKLGWKTGHDDDFDKHTILYSKNISPQGYSLWFLFHHSWIEDIDNDYTWWNTIGRDIIHEDWRDCKLDDDKRQNLKYDYSTRLTFAKGKNGQYFYIGLFKPIWVIQDRVDGPKGFGVYHTKVYQRIL